MKLWIKSPRPLCHVGALSVCLCRFVRDSGDFDAGWCQRMLGGTATFEQTASKHGADGRAVCRPRSVTIMSKTGGLRADGRRCRRSNHRSCAPRDYARGMGRDWNVCTWSVVIYDMPSGRGDTDLVVGVLPRVKRGEVCDGPPWLLSSPSMNRTPPSMLREPHTALMWTLPQFRVLLSPRGVGRLGGGLVVPLRRRRV